ncbi:MAG: DUF2254 domain-containing protein [Verrucomicrobiales bacterium]|nr:DUF2254 domain-containing protein [Verrucomicrobiales bacterium]
MTVRFLNRVLGLYRKVITSIGFWPTLISIGFSLAAVLLLSLNTEKPTTLLLERTPGLVIRDGDTARVILSTIVGSMVSLTVFSFTMVMSQLNRAASNYSPRLLPGLVSTRRHQVVLGTFLGTISFNLFVLINIEPSDDEYALPGLAVLTAIGLALISLGVFIYFIHSISRAIQVTNILKTVAAETRKRMEKLSDTPARSEGSPSGDAECTHAIVANKTGYLCSVNQSGLKTIAQDNEIVIQVTSLQGAFILENTQPLCTSEEVSEGTRNEILSCLVVSGDEQIDENYVLGFKQITEVAVRAMSPGTNDPGTAITAIDLLTELIAIRMQFDDEEIYENKDGNVSLIISVVTLPDLLYSLHAPLRLYCRHDVIIVLKLLDMFEHLLKQPHGRKTHRESVAKEVRSLKEDAQEALHSEQDCERVSSKADRILASFK